MYKLKQDRLCGQKLKNILLMVWGDLTMLWQVGEVRSQNTQKATFLVEAAFGVVQFAVFFLELPRSTGWQTRFWSLALGSPVSVSL
jgi:hypothetical protein